MATNEEIYVDGVPISDLRVVDLKEQLEKRGLSKSGSKTVLLKRLKDQLALEKLQEVQAGKDPTAAPNSEMMACGNDFVAKYLEQQQQMLQAAKLAAARSVAVSGQSPPTSATSSTTGSTPGTPDVENRLASPPASRRSKSTRKSPRQSVVEQETVHGSSGNVDVTPPAASVLLPTPAESSDKPDMVAEMISTPVELVPTPQKETMEAPVPDATGSEPEVQPSADTVESGSSAAPVIAATASTAEIGTADVPKEEPTVEEPPEDIGIQEKEAEPQHRSPSPPPKETELVSQSPTPAEVRDHDNTSVKAEGDQSAESLTGDFDGEKQAEGAVSPTSEVEAHEGGGQGLGNDDGGRGEDDSMASIPVDEPDEVEMEISAPINAADELFEAVNTTVSTTSMAGGKKMEVEEQESAPAAPEKENRDIPQRKRKWVAATLPKRTAVSISSDSLKDIVGSVKESVIEEESKRVVVEDSSSSPTPKRIVVSRDVSAADSSTELDTEIQQTRRVEIEVSRPPTKVTEDGFVRVSTPSPARHPPSNIIHVRGLTRPFTLPALHELLGKYGSFSKEDFWIDSIKSHCIVKYSDEAAAILARERLHNVQWPSSNTKSLRVDFASEEDLDRHRTQEGPAARLSRQNTENERERQNAPDRPSREVREIKISERDDRGRRSASPRRGDLDRDRSFDRSKPWRSGESPPTDPRGAGGLRRSQSLERKPTDAKPDQPAPPGKLLDELFRKTKATPCIYWLPLSADQIRDKERERKRRVQERFERVKKMEEEERERRREPYRRHSPVDYRSRRR